MTSHATTSTNKDSYTPRRIDNYQPPSRRSPVSSPPRLLATQSVPYFVNPSQRTSKNDKNKAVSFAVTSNTTSKSSKQSRLQNTITMNSDRVYQFPTPRNVSISSSRLITANTQYSAREPRIESQNNHQQTLPSFAVASNTNPNSKCFESMSSEQKYQDVIQKNEVLLNLLQAKQQECESLKRQNRYFVNLKSLPHDHNSRIDITSSLRQRIKCHNYDIETPRNSDIYPSECGEIIIIDDIINEIVSKQGINPSYTGSCNNRIKKILKLLPKLTILLNVLKKMIALFSTIFMIDCKLTGEGHFGIECLDQVRVISVDHSFHSKPNIYQHDKEFSIDHLNDKDECLLPYCSCIHPSKLRWHKIKTPELYSKCFQNQCNEPDTICLNKPNNSKIKCVMRSRTCINMKDWCGTAVWHPLELIPGNADMYNVQSRPSTDRKTQVKIEYDINCANGGICCRFLLGADITEEYYRENNVTNVLKMLCASFHSHSRLMQEYTYSYDPHGELREIVADLSKYPPAYINRDDISYIHPAFTFNKAAWIVVMDKVTYDQSVSSGGVSWLGDYFQNAERKSLHGLDINDFNNMLLQYYDDNALCLKVLSSK